MTVVVSSRADFTLANALRVGWEGEGVAFGEPARARMRACREAFLRLIDRPGITVYGVTSGYGQMAKVRLTPEQRRAHAARPAHAAMTSFGEPLPERVTRALVFARLTNYVEGHAAITPALAERVAAMLAAGALPPVPALGNGCAGEIQALSQLFTGLAQSSPLGEKDSLALINGSPCATALLTDSVLAARPRLELALAVFALAWEALQAPLDHLDAALEGLWADDAETQVLRALRGLLEGAPGDGRRPYQAPVSWRIVPRVLGQAARALAQGEEVASVSLRAVSDNPVYLPPDAAHPDGRVLSNGGYHNGKAYPAIDNLAAAWADVALLCDRQTTKLLDGAVSLLPHQLTAGAGTYLGCLGFTAAGYAEQARYAAQRTFLPGSEGGGFGQNDVAVPTFFAWRKQAEAGRCLDATLAVLAAIASQAFHVTERGVPPALEPLLAEVRELVPPVEEPRALGPEVAALQQRFTARVFARCRV